MKQILRIPALVLLTAGLATADTQEVVDAANAFLALLNTSQKTVSSSQSNSTCLFSQTLSNVTTWSNVPVGASTRNGLQFANLTTAQYNAALAVAEAALSDQGNTLMERVRLSDKYISGEVTNSQNSTSSMWGYNKYYIAFIGTPSTTNSWTLQLGGHHLAYNFTYNGTYESATPQFTGTEPNSFTISGTTYRPLGTQRDLLVSLRSTLSTSALLSGTFSDVVFGPNGTGTHDTVHPKSYPTSGRGQLYSSLTTAQQAIVLDYISSWVENSDGSLSVGLLADYTSEAALAETYVGYSGSSTSLASSGSYFRVDGPRLWIEYIVQGGVYDRSGVHDHGVFRDKLADYGAEYGSTTIATTIRPPEISVQPVGSDLAEGDTLTLSVTASGTGSTLLYQWYLDGEEISGATSATYTTTAATDDAGSYTVVVTNTAGVLASDVAAVTVSAATDPLQSWLDGYGIDENNDDDGDGVVALLEWFLGGDPTVRDASILPTLEADASGATYSFNMPAEVGSATWSADLSEDLVEWFEAIDGEGGVSFEFGTESDGLVPVAISLPSFYEKLFIQLNVSSS